MIAFTIGLILGSVCHKQLIFVKNKIVKLFRETSEEMPGMKR